MILTWIVLVWSWRPRSTGSPERLPRMPGRGARAEGSASIGSVCLIVMHRRLLPTSKSIVAGENGDGARGWPEASMVSPLRLAVSVKSSCQTESSHFGRGHDLSVCPLSGRRLFPSAHRRGLACLSYQQRTVTALGFDVAENPCLSGNQGPEGRIRLVGGAPHVTEGSEGNLSASEPVQRALPPRSHALVVGSPRAPRYSYILVDSCLGTVEGRMPCWL